MMHFYLASSISVLAEFVASLPSYTILPSSMQPITMVVFPTSSAKIIVTNFYGGKLL